MVSLKHIVAITHVVFDVMLNISLLHTQIYQFAYVCSGDYPASYKGYSLYKDIQRSRKQTTYKLVIFYLITLEISLLLLKMAKLNNNLITKLTNRTR